MQVISASSVFVYTICAALLTPIKVAIFWRLHWLRVDIDVWRKDDLQFSSMWQNNTHLDYVYTEKYYFYRNVFEVIIWHMAVHLKEWLSQLRWVCTVHLNRYTHSVCFFALVVVRCQKIYPYNPGLPNGHKGSCMGLYSKLHKIYA